MLVASFDLFLIELATDNGTVVHLEENEFSVDGSFVGVNTTQVVGQLETDDALPVPLLRLDGFDIRSHRISLLTYHVKSVKTIWPFRGVEPVRYAKCGCLPVGRLLL